MSSEDDTGNRMLLKTEDVEFLDSIIARFMQAPMKRDENNNEPTAEMNVPLAHDEIQRICVLSVDALRTQPALVRIQRSQLPLTLCGDLHGQMRDVRIIVEQFGSMDKHTFLFMGDYGDRGTQGVETVIFLLANRIRFPNRVYMLRGNHEDYNTSMIYGLLDECVTKFGSFYGPRVWLNLINVYNYLPFAAVIADKIFCLHGGLSPHLRNLNDINKIPRPTVIPLYGLACDLVWSDPSRQHEGWALSPRGISFTFDDKVAERFCQQHGLDLIVRGHQISNEMHRSGFNISPNQRVLTLFTACDYLRSQNTGAVLTVDQSLELKFFLFRPMTRKRLRRARMQQSRGSASTLKDQSSSKESSTGTGSIPNLCCDD